MGRDPFCMDHGCIGGNRQVQVVLVNASEGAQGGTKRGPRSVAGVAVDLAHAIVSISTGPLRCAVTHRGRGRLAATRAGPASVESPVLPGGTWSAMRGWQGCLCAGSQTHQRGAPVSREMRLLMGGRSLAEVPCPWRVLARRRGGAVGSR